MLRRRRNRANEDIRALIKNSPVFSYEVAAEFGLGSEQFSGRLQVELTDDEKQEIKDVLKKLTSKVLAND